MKIEVDAREPKELITMLKSQIDQVEVTNLDIGDVVIKNNNDEIIVIIERKSLSDLLSSIKDGRYAEQSYRLEQLSIHNHNIYYIIEGNINNFILKNKEINQKILFSAIFSLSYYKGFSIIKTNDIIETGETIGRFMKKLESDKRKSYYSCGRSDISMNYSETLKISKKSNITKENIGEIMLAQIPGVSIYCAQAVMKQYFSIKNLICELEKNKQCLDNLIINCKNTKRKISKPAVQNIKDFLINI